MQSDAPFPPFPSPYPPPPPPPPIESVPSVRPEPVNPWPPPSVFPLAEKSLPSESKIPEIDFNEKSLRVPHPGWAIVLAVIIFLLVVVVPTWYFLKSKSKQSVTVPPAPPVVEIFVPPPPPVFENSSFISAETGGKIITQGSRGSLAEIDIPPGALRENTMIEIEYVRSANAKEDATDLYLLKPFGTTFLKPVSVTLPYYEELLNKQGVSEDKIRLYVWSDENEKRLLHFIIDREKKQLRAQLMQF